MSAPLDLLVEDAAGRAGALVPLGIKPRLRELPQPDAVVVLRFSALGDVLLSSPAIEALRRAWPETRIVYAVKERLASLLAGNPDVTEVLALGEHEGAVGFALRLRRLLAGAKTVGVLDLHGKIRSLLIRSLLPRSWRRVVWHKRDFGDTLPVKLGLRPWRAGMLFADRYHAAVEELVGRRLPRGRLRAFVAPADVERASDILRRAGIDPARPLVGLSPGANWATKRWPVEYYAELAGMALRAGLQVAVQGSEAERPLGAQIAAAAPGVADLTGQLDVAALGGFTSLCAAVVANDSGPMHLARALGVPTLALFGSTDPEMFAWAGHRVLFTGIECAPCSFFGRRRCPRGHFKCMTEIGAPEAWRALEQLLRQGRAGPLGA